MQAYVRLDAVVHTLAEIVRNLATHWLSGRHLLHTCRSIALCVVRASGQRAGLDGSRVGDQDTSRHIRLCGARGTGVDTS